MKKITVQKTEPVKLTSVANTMYDCTCMEA
ncbi:hypothetical protein PMI05_01233 [Brevibacillus sp. BC25]|nr:hypothetical protein PMI05_01233 [Brevibacillus sp. BC25]